ncbi:MAG: enoyl-CoA hydratase, partial [Mesorhizobium sp.]
MTDHILVERQGAIQIIRMNRPDKKNALTRAMYAKMSKALAEGDADPPIRVHVFLGVPGAFSSGNDLADFMVVATGREGGTEVWDFRLALARTEKPMISG